MRRTVALLLFLSLFATATPGFATSARELARRKAHMERLFKNYKKPKFVRTGHDKGLSQRAKVREERVERQMIDDILKKECKGQPGSKLDACIQTAKKERQQKKTGTAE